MSGMLWTAIGNAFRRTALPLLSVLRPHAGGAARKRRRTV